MTAGLLLVATLLVTVLIAHGQHLKQIRSAHRRLAAVEAAEGLLSEWLHRSNELVAKRTGVVGEDDWLRWHVEVSSADGMSPLGVQVLRLEIYDNRESRKADSLANIEVLISAWDDQEELSH